MKQKHRMMVAHTSSPGDIEHITNEAKSNFFKVLQIQHIDPTPLPPAIVISNIYCGGLQ
jgi:hypothetical protein